ncbi:hypothetical protein DB88DRAFT_473043 [Papiliotrema laurentii]|uniref:Uncharacterized protein n=1 Tax=Papiliotrema laurentii TaxID=5418 RepID=A0AAD9FL57_PAPLA|nr:hypothetical protein DB88DRAFT_473043 [Papiliotrema laurentii]
MVSTLQKRLMINTISAKCASSKSCRLCHGPLTSCSPTSPPIRAAALSGEEVDCHPSCLPFACRGCIDKDRSNYGLLDLSNDSCDGHCALCAEDDEEGEGWGGRVVLSSSP